MKTHILLIDDDIEEMKIFVEALKGVGAFKCTYAANGVYALKMLLYLRPEAIFTKYDMPVMNGLQVAEDVKKIESLENIPFFLYAKRIDMATMKKASRLEITGCLETSSAIDGLPGMLKKIFPLSPVHIT